MEQPVYISTGGMPELPAPESIARLVSAGIRHVELSGGVHLESGMGALSHLLEDVSLRIHNYFPPPRDPFVLNLASASDEIASRSVEHVREALVWAKEIGGGIYSVHAGFRMDPAARELGQRIANTGLSPRAEALSRFVDRVSTLAADADALGVELLIENNVLSVENLAAFGEDPFLMTEPDECARVMERTPSGVGLLFDVAHANVSARSLGFDPGHMVRSCQPWTRAYHLSENDGFTDSNEPVQRDSWFWQHLSSDVAYCSLEVYGLSDEALAAQASLAGEALGESGMRH